MSHRHLQLMEIRKEKKKKKKHTRCTDHSHVPSVQHFSSEHFPSKLRDFHGWDITTDKPSTPQIVPGSPQSLGRISRLRVEAELELPL